MKLDDKLKHLYEMIENTVECVFKKKEERNSKRIIPKHIKKLLSKKKKLSDKIMAAKSLVKLNKLKDEFSIIEKQLNDSYESHRKKHEMDVIDKIETDPGAFYRFARSKSTLKHDIGPLRDKYEKLKTKRSEMSEILADQYQSICTEPRESLNDTTFLQSLHSESTDLGLSDIVIDYEKVDRALRKL